MDAKPSNRPIPLIEICRGLARQEFVFYYQPLYSLVTGKVCGAEALLRWVRPDGTVTLPAAFIPQAVAKGFITEMTEEMFPRLIADLGQILPSDGFVTVFLNLSAADMRSTTLVREIAARLADGQIAPHNLGVEIVEDVLMPPDPRIRQTIFDFAALSIPLVLNDFSAGNTTLNYLSQLPLWAIKLSMNIVQRAPLGRLDFRVLRHLVSMGHQLNLNVIAEGVETRELYDLVLSTGCTAAQGFYFSYPLPLPEFIALLEKRSAWVNYPFGLEYLAQIDHIDFRRDVIREALIIYNTRDPEAQHRALARLPELEAERCLLGQWYHGIGQQWQAVPEFTELGALHRRFHAVAEAIVAAARNGENNPRFEQRIDELNRLSGAILLLVQKFAQRGLKQHYNL